MVRTNFQTSFLTPKSIPNPKVYHRKNVTTTNHTISLLIALFKLKPNTDPEKVKEWQKLAHEMVGKVPGTSYTSIDVIRNTKVITIGPVETSV